MFSSTNSIYQVRPFKNIAEKLGGHVFLDFRQIGVRVSSPCPSNRYTGAPDPGRTPPTPKIKTLVPIISYQTQRQENSTHTEKKEQKILPTTPHLSRAVPHHST